MAVELTYKKLIEKHKLKITDLPEDAQNGIQMITEVTNGIKMLEAKNMVPKDRTIKRLKSMDKWVYNEILDHINDTEENEEEMPDEELEEEVDEIEEQLKKKNATPPAQQSQKGNPPATPPATIDDKSADAELGIAIEAELDELIQGEKREFAIEELKGKASKTYKLLFDTYEKDGKNGVETTKYSLLETSTNVFTLKQK